jgi:hypothetical protein
MRLSKHTLEEIEEARSASRIEITTDEQWEEWKKIHQSLNRRIISDAGEEGWGARITNLDGVIFPMLGDDGIKIARAKGTSTILEILRNNKTGKCFPWYKSGLLGYDHITEEAIEGADCDKVFVFSRFLVKVIEVDKGDDEAIEYWIKRFAALFNRLAYYKKIEYGILSNFSALPLADLEAERKVQEAALGGLKSGKSSDELADELTKIRKDAMEEAKTMRVALMVYPYSHFETEELNNWLGNHAFAEEGELGSGDWDNLPDVE